jgi:hypothetical protein
MGKIDTFPNCTKHLNMGSLSPSAAEAGPTTSEADQAEVARIKRAVSARNAEGTIGTQGTTVPSVSIEEGANKYVLATATDPNNEERAFVYSRRSASYHGEEKGGGVGMVAHRILS